MITRSYSRDAKLLISVTGSLAASFFGVQMLLKVLYILSLGHGPKYVGWFTAASALAYMGMGLPSGALGNRFGTRSIMRIGSLATVAGMALLPVTEYLPAWAQNLWPFVSQIVLIVGWSMFNVNLVPMLAAATEANERSRAFALSSAVRGNR